MCLDINLPSRKDSQLNSSLLQGSFQFGTRVRIVLSKATVPCSLDTTRSTPKVFACAFVWMDGVSVLRRLGPGWRRESLRGGMPGSILQHQSAQSRAQVLCKQDGSRPLICNYFPPVGQLPDCVPGTAALYLALAYVVPRSYLRRLASSICPARWQLEQTTANDTAERNRLQKLMGRILGEIDAVSSELMANRKSV
jgi:hypothetical protein